jgi:hypothetical protein
MVKEYHGQISHNERTIKLMFKMAYHIYEKKRILIRVCIGVVLIMASVLVAFPRYVQAILMMLGTWKLTARDFPATIRAQRTIETRKGTFPVMTYTFTDKGIVLQGEGTTNLQYNQFQYLVEDNKYLYLFLGKQSVCMIDKATITPSSIKQLMFYVEKKTGLKWTRNKSFFNMNLDDFLQYIQTRKLF